MKQKEKKQLIILGVGVTIWIISWVYTHRTTQTVVAPAVGEGGIVSPVSTPAQVYYKEEPIKAKKIGEIKYTGRENRDPLDNTIVLPKAELVTVQEKIEEEKPFPKENFLISAVIWGSKNPQAIINDKVVGIGDIIDGGKIVKIDREGVRIDYGGKEILLGVK